MAESYQANTQDLHLVIEQKADQFSIDIFDRGTDALLSSKQYSSLQECMTFAQKQYNIPAQKWKRIADT